jgi:tetratricopeptide (TPR) repeat protein
MEITLKSKFIATAFLIISLGLFAYINSFENQFIWDDEDAVVNNAYVKDFKYLPNIFKENSIQGAKKGSNFYRPLWNISFLLDYKIWGLNPTGYHLTNTILHIINALLLAYLLSGLSCWSIGALAGILFVVHPVHTEVVTYISGRADSLAALFILTSSILFLKSLISQEAKIRNCLYMLSIFSFIAGLLSKESSIVFPTILISLVLFFGKGESGVQIKKRAKKKDGDSLGRLKYTLPFISIAVIYAILRFTILDFSETVGQNLPPPFFYIPFHVRLFTFLKALLIYFGLLLLPLHLQMERTLKLAYSLFEPMSLAAMTITILFLLLAIKSYPRHRIISFSILWFYLTLLPNSNLYPINALIYEHWLYLPSMGFFTLLSWSIYRMYRIPNKKALKAVLGFFYLIAITFYFLRTIERNRDWRDPITFYESALKHSPDSARMHNNLGMAYDDKGMLDLAIQEYQKAIEINDSYPQTHYNLAGAYMKKGWIKQAEKEYRRSIEIDPNFVYSYISLGRLYYFQGRIKESKLIFQEVLELDPKNKEAKKILNQLKRY